MSKMKVNHGSVPGINERCLTDISSPLISFLSLNRCFTGQKDKDGHVQERNKATHIIMDGVRGGTFILPDHLHNEFLDRLGQDLQDEYKHFIIEKRTKVFRMFIDFDVSIFTGNWNDELITSVMNLIIETIKLFYPDDSPLSLFDVIVTNPDSQPTKSTDFPDSLRVGLHPIFPNLFVTTDQALHIREALVSKFAQRFPIDNNGGFQQDWDKIFDSAVYIGNGLRITGCSKVSICPKCKNDDIEFMSCLECHQRGKINIGRIYRVCMVIINGELDSHLLQIYKENISCLLQRVSIRSFLLEPSPNWSLYIGAPRALHPEIKTSKNGTETWIQPSGFKEDEKTIAAIRNKIFVPKEHPIVNLLEKEIRNFTFQYKHIHIDRNRVFTNKNRTYYHCSVKGEGSSYCLNYQRDHRSNTVYFIFKPSGIIQQCYCRCETQQGRRAGYCKDWRSTEKPLSQEIIETLFGSPETIRSIKGCEVYSKDPTGHLTQALQLLLCLANRMAAYEGRQDPPIPMKPKDSIMFVPSGQVLTHAMRPIVQNVSHSSSRKKIEKTNQASSSSSSLVNYHTPMEISLL